MALHNNQGLFVTLEGGEGAGKSTQSHLLSEALGSLGYDVVLTREPGGTSGAEAIRNLLLYGDSDLSWRSEIMAHMAARCDHLDSLILPALRRGAIVVCDRFHDSTFAYQGYGIGHARPERLEFIKNARLLVGYEPSVTLLLEVSREQAIERLRRRGGLTDRYEGQEEAFHERVRLGFSYMADFDPQRVKCFNAVQNPEKLKIELLNELLKNLENK